jgi:hypothetical protein
MLIYVSSSLLAAGKTPVIPPKGNRKLQRAYDKELYKARYLMEDFHCKLKQYRAIATRYDITARSFLAAIHLAAAVIWGSSIVRLFCFPLGQFYFQLALGPMVEFLIFSLRLA